MKYILLLFLLTGCASLPPILTTLRPVDANKYELPFEYLCDGKMVFAYGIATCQYPAGSTMSVRIKVPTGVEGQIQVRSCRHQRAINVDQSTSWQGFQWVQYTLEDSCPIEMAVALEGAGIQLGKIVPYVYTDKFPKMNAQGSLYCFSTEKNEDIDGVLACQYPTGIRVNGTLQVNPLKSGRYMIIVSCGSNVGPKPFPVGTLDIPWTTTMNTPGTCPVSYVVSYDDATEDEGLISLEFFNNRYSSFPPPVQKGNEVCAPDDYLAFDVDDKQSKDKLFSVHCRKFNPNTRAIVWDDAGRVSIWSPVPQTTKQE